MRHIALATLDEVDSLVSWNFKHVVRLEEIRLFNEVTVQLGYKVLSILSPREVTTYEGSWHSSGRNDPQDPGSAQAPFGRKNARRGDCVLSRGWSGGAGRRPTAREAAQSGAASTERK
jgi:hypothetical protein